MSLSISIAMCTYNGAHFLRQQLQSFVDQTVKPDELIVCDDASSDESVQLVEDLPLPVVSHLPSLNGSDVLAVTVAE